MYNVNVIGLVYFNVCSVGSKIGLAPNGMNPSGDIAPHHASFFVEPEHYAGASWWDSQMFAHVVKVIDNHGVRVDKPLLEFRIPEPAEIHFPVQPTDVPVVGNLNDGLPQLEKIDPTFQLDQDHADAIARLPVEGGNLKAFSFLDFPVVQWTFANADPTFTIEAVDAKGGKHTITLRDGDGQSTAEVVFSNTEEVIAPPADKPDGSHFALYAKLSTTRDPSHLTPPEDLKEGLQGLPSNHTYLEFLAAKAPQVPGTECGPTCC